MNNDGIANVNPFRYRGYYYDWETRYYYLQTRYYDAEVGRFLNADYVKYLNPKIIHGCNLYAYCGNNPVIHTDKKGTDFWQDVADFFEGLLEDAVETIVTYIVDPIVKPFKEMFERFDKVSSFENIYEASSALVGNIESYEAHAQDYFRTVIAMTGKGYEYESKYTYSDKYKKAMMKDADLLSSANDGWFKINLSSPTDEEIRMLYTQYKYKVFQGNDYLVSDYSSHTFWDGVQCYWEIIKFIIGGKK